MNGCMISYATIQEQDRAREEWFATREDRRRERALKEQEHQEALIKKREYWIGPQGDKSDQAMDRGKSQ